MRIRVERADGVGRIILARPEKKNALDLAAARELRESLREFAADSAVRVVLLSAQGDDFCAGADLSALNALLDADAATQLQDAEALGDVFRVMREMPQVVVAAVRGRALAGGAGLATACDIVIAHEDARFGYPEVRVGFVPAMVMAILRRLVGEKRAFELVATGRQVNAPEAMELFVRGDAQVHHEQAGDATRCMRIKSSNVIGRFAPDSCASPAAHVTLSIPSKNPPLHIARLMRAPLYLRKELLPGTLDNVTIC